MTTKTDFYFAGIDYSMTSPAIAICNGEWKIQNCFFFYLTQNKKYEGHFLNGKINGQLFPEWHSPEERFYIIAQWAVARIAKCQKINMEGYSYGSTGKVFEIAENLGLLKHYLFKYNHDFKITEPTVIKKYATGKGNAGKDLMEESFIKETGIDLKQVLGMTEKNWNPSSDIIDSYYIGKYLYEKL